MKTKEQILILILFLSFMLSCKDNPKSPNVRIADKQNEERIKRYIGLCVIGGESFFDIYTATVWCAGRVMKNDTSYAIMMTTIHEERLDQVDKGFIWVQSLTHKKFDTLRHMKRIFRFDDSALCFLVQDNDTFWKPLDIDTSELRSDYVYKGFRINEKDVWMIDTLKPVGNNRFMNFYDVKGNKFIRKHSPEFAQVLKKEYSESFETDTLELRNLLYGLAEEGMSGGPMVYMTKNYIACCGTFEAGSSENMTIVVQSKLVKKNLDEYKSYLRSLEYVIKE